VHEGTFTFVQFFVLFEKLALTLQLPFLQELSFFFIIIAFLMLQFEKSSHEVTFCTALDTIRLTVVHEHEGLFRHKLFGNSRMPQVVFEFKRVELVLKQLSLGA
jgi:hypothetical protein